MQCLVIYNGVGPVVLCSVWRIQQHCCIVHCSVSFMTELRAILTTLRLGFGALHTGAIEIDNYKITINNRNTVNCRVAKLIKL